MIGKPFIKLNSVDSTNNYAMEQLKKEAATAGTAYFAMEQTKGKGQRSKTWYSEKGSNIILSVIIDAAALQLTNPFILNCAVAVAARSFFNKYVLKDVSIKWPNDLYYDDRKAGGILIENLWQGSNWLYAVAGLGININQTHFIDNLKAVSLKQITGRHFDVEQLAVDLCETLDDNLQLLKKDSSLILKTYNNHLYKLNETVVFTKGEEQFTATVKSVDHKGKLHILADEIIILRHGDAEWSL